MENDVSTYPLRGSILGLCRVQRCQIVVLVACKQGLQGTLAAGWEKEGELVTMSLEFEFHLHFPHSSPSTELSDFHHSVQSGNELECKQTLKNTCQW